MRNFGNTCYFNSTLQCLLQVFTVKNYKGTCEITKAFEKLCCTHDPEEILRLFQARFLQFAPGQPHDAQEALIHLLDIFEPIIKNFVQGEMIQETICPSGTVKTIVQTVVISLPVAESRRVPDCLKKFQEWNALGDYQDNAGKVWNVSATRTIFSKLPKVLILSINDKTIIDVDETLMIDKFKYILVATCIHMGNRNGGHYVALIKDQNTWVLKDDEIEQRLDAFPRLHSHYFMIYNLENSTN